MGFCILCLYVNKSWIVSHTHILWWSVLEMCILMFVCVIKVYKRLISYLAPEWQMCMFSLTSSMYSLIPKVIGNALHLVGTVQRLWQSQVRFKPSCLVCGETSGCPPGVSSATHTATPTMIFVLSVCFGDGLRSREFPVVHPSRALGTPGGQNGMKRVQDEDRWALMPRGRL